MDDLLRDIVEKIEDAPNPYENEKTRSGFDAMRGLAIALVKDSFKK